MSDFNAEAELKKAWKILDTDEDDEATTEEIEQRLIERVVTPAFVAHYNNKLDQAKDAHYYAQNLMIAFLLAKAVHDRAKAATQPQAAPVRFV